MREERERDPDVDAVMREEQSRRGDRPWLDTDARQAQRKREREQAEDEKLILKVIQRGKGSLEKVLRGLRDAGVPAHRLKRVERLWKELFPEQ